MAPTRRPFVLAICLLLTASLAGCTNQGALCGLFNDDCTWTYHGGETITTYRGEWNETMVRAWLEGLGVQAIGDYMDPRSPDPGADDGRGHGDPERDDHPEHTRVSAPAGPMNGIGGKDRKGVEWVFTHFPSIQMPDEPGWIVVRVHHPTTVPHERMTLDTAHAHGEAEQDVAVHGARALIGDFTAESGWWHHDGPLWHMKIHRISEEA